MHGAPQLTAMTMTAETATATMAKPDGWRLRLTDGIGQMPCTASVGQMPCTDWCRRRTRTARAA